MVESRLDLPFVAALAHREKQSQQTYRPYIAVHKWFARRPGSLFRSLLIAEYGSDRLRREYYTDVRFPHLRIGDPFMGGGTVVAESIRLGCAVIASDIDPVAHWIVQRQTEPIDVARYDARSADVLAHVEQELGAYYRTTCPACASRKAQVKAFLWVRTEVCPACAATVDLLPSYVIASKWRHPHFVIVCSKCGRLNSSSRKRSCACQYCKSPLVLHGNAVSDSFRCTKCGRRCHLPGSSNRPPVHRLYAIEYFCPSCTPTSKCRTYKTPDTRDYGLYDLARRRLGSVRTTHAPRARISRGVESDRLRRVGYVRYSDLFNARQLLALETAARAIASVRERRLREALVTNLSDLLRYQSVLCRYDTTALKPVDAFAYHGFRVGHTYCEPNFLGVEADGRVLGSGGLRQVFRKYARAKRYWMEPFEDLLTRDTETRISVENAGLNGCATKAAPGGARVQLLCSPASDVPIRPNSLDAVLTDPPYFANVQYSELMALSRVWLAKIDGGFKVSSQAAGRHRAMSTDGQRGRLQEYASGLSAAFTLWTRALKPGGLFAFTFHHASLSAYGALLVAILDAGLTCSMCFPCPSEMHGSTHIARQNAARIDTVFVCRRPRRKQMLVRSVPDEEARFFERILRRRIGTLTEADRRCVRAGLSVVKSVRRLRRAWSAKEPIDARLGKASRAVSDQMAAES